MTLYQIKEFCFVIKREGVPQTIRHRGGIGLKASPSRLMTEMKVIDWIHREYPDYLLCSLQIIYKEKIV